MALRSSVRRNEPICVITIVRMDKDQFTNGDPPRGKVLVDEVLNGPQLPKEVDMVWDPGPIPLCGNDHNPRPWIREWNNIKWRTFAPREKQVVWLYRESLASKPEIAWHAKYSQDTVDRMKATLKQIRLERAALQATWQKADIRQLVATSTDIVVGNINSGSSQATCTSVLVRERLKDSALAHEPPDLPPTVSLDKLYNNGQYLTIAKCYLNGNGDYKGDFILFLRASETAYKWQAPKGYPGALPGVCPNYYPAMHGGQYKKLASVYFPTNDRAWILPLTPERLKQTKAAVAAQSHHTEFSTNLHHFDRALELVQAECFLDHIRKTKWASSKDAPFTIEELKQREALIRNAIKQFGDLFGKDNGYSVDMYAELAETLRRQKRHTEGAAALREGKDMRERIEALNIKMIEHG